MYATVLAVWLMAAKVFAQTQTVGLLYYSADAPSGYVLFAPMNSKTTYLVDRCGRLIHSW